jgi:N-formylglutamate amidohydrolase
MATRDPQSRRNALDPRLKLWLQNEERFTGPTALEAPERLVYIPGTSGILLTAPHSTRHIRQGATKPADLATGALAATLASLSQSSALLVYGDQLGDAAWTDDHPLKQRLVDLLPKHRLVLDLHGMRDDWGVDICIGTAGSPSNPLASLVQRAATRRGLIAALNTPFDARRPATITAFTIRHAVSALQIEVARRFRIPAAFPTQATRLLDCLLDAIEDCLHAMGSTQNPVS